jgi:hypothetical protein
MTSTCAALAYVATTLAGPAVLPSSASKFVTRSGAELLLDNDPFYAVGPNVRHCLFWMSHLTGSARSTGWA